MRKLILLIFLIPLWVFGQSRSVEITGKILDKNTNEGLESATVYIENPSDSNLIAYSITDTEGNFKIETRTYLSEVLLHISFVGYQPIERKLRLKDKKTSLGSISLSEGGMLGEVELTEKAVPLIIKKDTLEFNADSFKAKENATVEDLLKKLPGVEITKDGKIMVNGKEVKNITVNGKSFFGNDPTIATKNLTKEMIEKIQITDSKTKAEALTGEKGNTEEKSINLTIKKDKNKGIFGRVSAGIGTDERYEGAGLFNYFNNDRRISVLFGQNNINTAGFGFGEIRKMYGGGRSMTRSSNGSFSIDGMQFGGANGITTSRNAGLNYDDKINANTDIGVKYFHSGITTETAKEYQREYSLPDQSKFKNSGKNSGDRTINNHNFGLEMAWKKDTTWYISYEPRLNLSESESKNISESETRNSDGEIANKSKSVNESDFNNLDFQNDLDISHNIGNKGSSIRLRYQDQFVNTRSDNFQTLKLSEPLNNTETNRDQKVTTASDKIVFRPEIAYRHALKKKKLYWKTGYRLNYSQLKNEKSTFDKVGNSFNDFNKDLSSNFEYNSVLHAPFTGLELQDDKLYANFFVGYSWRTLENRDFLRSEQTISRSFQLPSFNAYIWKRMKKQKSLYASVRFSNQNPSLQQLQTFRDLSNPSNIRVGNPNLEVTKRWNGYFGFNKRSLNKGWSYYFYGNFNYRNDAIIDSVSISDNFIRTSSYTNANGKYNTYTSASLSRTFEVDSVKSFKALTRISFQFYNDLFYNNGILGENKINSLNPQIGATYEHEDLWDISLSYDWERRKSEFALEHFEDNEVIVHNVELDLNWDITKRLRWENTLDFMYTPALEDIYDNQVLFWNSKIAYDVLEDKATLSLKAYDLLRQNNSVQRRIRSNYTESSSNLVLQPYFMLSLTYKFNTMTKKKQKNDFEGDWF
ncbi:MAG: outer membrane beta-barrel protein [Flavobacteriales bacterium]|jgi:hypothetical protein|nr:outer membrane beta-barrel protein [Flavobacteriales bacterium]